MGEWDDGKSDSITSVRLRVCVRPRLATARLDSRVRAFRTQECPHRKRRPEPRIIEYRAKDCPTRVKSVYHGYQFGLRMPAGAGAGNSNMHTRIPYFPYALRYDLSHI